MNSSSLVRFTVARLLGMVFPEEEAHRQKLSCSCVWIMNEYMGIAPDLGVQVGHGQHDQCVVLQAGCEALPERTRTTELPASAD